MTGPWFVVVSGKMFSGKDTLADGLADLLRAERPVERVTFSDLICVEADRGIDVLRAGGTLRQIGEALDLDGHPHWTYSFVRAVLPELEAKPDLTARDRTPGTRVVLQRLGKEWRPAGYWARRVVGHCVAHRDGGEHVVMVGARFPEP